MLRTPQWFSILYILLLRPVCVQHPTSIGKPFPGSPEGDWQRLHQPDTSPCEHHSILLLPLLPQFWYPLLWICWCLSPPLLPESPIRTPNIAKVTLLRTMKSHLWGAGSELCGMKNIEWLYSPISINFVTWATPPLLFSAFLRVSCENSHFCHHLLSSP